ncbi:MAG TPA: hypothetical protein VGB89_12670 [Bacteroidota bacterium]
MSNIPSEILAGSGYETPRVAYEMLSRVMKSTARRNPLKLMEAGVLKIIDKEAQLRPLIPSFTQKRLLHVVRTVQERNLPVRIHGLKARQVYFSTAVEAIFYCIVANTPNKRGMVLADDVPGSEYLFKMQSVMHEELKKDFPFLVADTRRETIQGIEFDELRSSVITQTARNLRAGRKYTLHLLHLSESAFYPDYDTLTTGLFQAVPNEPGTMIINESTANGMAGGFYRAIMATYTPNGTWDKELKAYTAPSGWVLLFIPWYEHHEYVLSEEQSLDGIRFASAEEEKQFFADERALRQMITEYHVSEGKTEDVAGLVQRQLNWRRDCIRGRCKGELRVFDQEYPDSVETAFIASGRPALNIAVVMKNLKLTRYKKPKMIGNLEWVNHYKLGGEVLYGPHMVNGVCLNFNDLRVQFNEEPLGLWKVYRKPEPGWVNRYCIGADVAEGLEQGDFDAGCVIDRLQQSDSHTEFVEVAATLLAHLDVDLYSMELVKMALYYHNAVLNIERNNHGLAVINKVHQIYKRLYFREDFSKGFPEVTSQIGFLTTEQTKKNLVDTLNEWIRTEMLRSSDPEFWGQAKTFVKDARGRIGAQGKREDPATPTFDDQVMGHGIALMTHIWMPTPQREKVLLTGWRKKLQKKQTTSKGSMAV